MNEGVMANNQMLDQLHKNMISQVQDYAIILLDKQGKILSWNVGAEKINGYEALEIINENFKRLFLPQDITAGLPDQLIDLAVTEGRSAHIGRRLRKDGSIYWGNTNITALTDKEGNVIGFTKLTREVADQE